MMTPMGPDLRLTGGTELGGLKAPPTTRHLDSLNHHAGEILPDHPVEAAQSWIGYRPSLPDFLPAMGRLKSDPRLFISTGHQHLGLTLGAISAQLMRDLILDRPTRLDMSPYTPHRFHTL